MTSFSQKTDANAIASRIAKGTGFELLRRPCPSPNNERGFKRWNRSLQSLHQQVTVLKEKLVKGEFVDRLLMGRVEKRLDIVRDNAPQQDRAILQKAKAALSTESVIEAMRTRGESTPTSLFPTFKKGAWSAILQALYLQGAVTPAPQIAAGRASDSSGPTKWITSPVQAVRDWWRTAPQIPSKIVPKTEIPKIKQVQNHAAQLRNALAKTTQEKESGLEPCFAIEGLESDLTRLMVEVRSEIMPDDKELHKFGNKHANLVKMAHIAQKLGLPDLIIPMPRGISTDQTRAFLEKRAPVVFQLWNEIGEMGLSLNSPEAQSRLAQIDEALDGAFKSPDAYQDLGLSPEQLAWLEGLKQAGDSLMVRSTGAEDSNKAANAGGNVSKAYVSPTPAALCEAVGAVVRSYFSQSSLQNRVNAGMNPFQEKLSLAVTAQQLIGEPVGGTTNPDQIPVSFVAFTSEPMYANGEKFRAMRISMTYGHGEGVVSGEGIGTDTILVLHSESQPDQLYYLYNNQDKPQRLAPLQQGDRFVLGKVDNDPSFAKRAALSGEDLLKIYASAISMEAAFGYGPNDIEGVVKGGKVYFVQDRPVNRKELLPTYLDTLKGKESILSKLQVETLVPGKGNAVAITNREEILFAPTLQEAERNFRPADHKLVIVTHPEPENSHPVVNFSEQGIPCLYSDDSEALNALLARISPERSLVACMQTAALYLWDTSKAPMDDAIVKGWAVHPAKIAISLPIPASLKPFMTLPVPKDMKDLFLQLQGTKSRKEALRLLARIENHPLIKNLRSPPPSSAPGVAERLEALQALDLQIRLAINESRAVIEKRGSTPLKRLIRLKALGTLLFGPSRGISQLSLMDAEPIIESIAQLSAYQKRLSHPAHLIDLVLDGQRANPEANAAWEGFLMELEPLIEKGTIAPAQVEAFKGQIELLRNSGSLPFWLTFFQGNSAPAGKFSAPQEARTLERFKQILENGFSESDKALVDSFLKEQQAIQQMGAQLSRFAEPESFETAFAELEDHVNHWRSQQKYAAIKAKMREAERFDMPTSFEQAWVDESSDGSYTENIQDFEIRREKEAHDLIKNAPPIVQAIAYRTIRDGVTLLDNAIKTMKASPKFSDPIKLFQFKQMVQIYERLMKSIGTGLVGANRIPHHANWPWAAYVRKLEASPFIENGEGSVQFRASPNFSVAAAIITAKTDFDRHLPQTVEDAMTLIHQNLEALLAIANDGILTPNQIQQSHLPRPIKHAIQSIEGTNWGQRIERVGIEIREEEIVVRYNVPLRNHSGHIDLHYDIRSGKLTFKAQLLGQARQRWGQTANWVRALEASAFHPERPLSLGELELTFSWGISSPDQLKNALREYVAMAEYSLGGQALADAIGGLYTRWENRPEFAKLMDYFFQVPHLAAQQFYNRYLNTLFQSSLQRLEPEKFAVAISNSSDEVSAKWFEFLKTSARGSKGALVQAFERSSFSEAQKGLIQHYISESSSEKPLFDLVLALARRVRNEGNGFTTGLRDLFIHFVKQGHVHQEFIELAKVRAHNNSNGLDLFKALIENGHAYDAAFEYIKESRSRAQNLEFFNLIPALGFLQLIAIKGLTYKYDAASRQFTFNAELFGKLSNEKQESFSKWIRVLEGAQILTSETFTTPEKGDLSFTWTIASPENFEKIVDEYISMMQKGVTNNDLNLWPSILSNLYMRWADRAEMGALTLYFLQNPQKDAHLFYDHYLENLSTTGPYRMEQQKLVTALCWGSGSYDWEFLFKNLDVMSSKEALLSVTDVFTPNGAQINPIYAWIEESSSERPLLDLMLALAHTKLKSIDQDWVSEGFNLLARMVRGGYIDATIIELAKKKMGSQESLVLFKALVEKGYEYETAFQAAKERIPYDDALDILKLLAEKGYDPEAIIDVLKEIPIKDYASSYTKLQKLIEVLDALLEKGHGVQFGIEAATVLCNSPFLSTKIAGVRQFSNLFKRGYGQAAAFNIANEQWGGNGGSEDDRIFAIELIKELVLTAKYEPAYPAALQMASEGFKVRDLDVGASSQQILLALIEKEYRLESILEIANNAVTDKYGTKFHSRSVDEYGTELHWRFSGAIADDELRERGFDLYRALIQKDYQFETILEWANQAIHSDNTWVKLRSLRLFEAFVRKGYAYKPAREAALVAIQDSESVINKPAALLLTLLGSKK